MKSDQQIFSYIYQDDGIDTAACRAAAVAEVYKRLSTGIRISFLEQIAVEIGLIREALISTACKETALPVNRLNAEIDRTINQVKLFAALLKEGSWVKAVIDTAMPERVPVPRPDIRQMQVPLGVIAVFGAGNFPFAFSVAGGDTVAALAAGCPVLYKVHNGHPQTSMLVGECIWRAVAKANIPGEVFSLLFLSQGAGIHIVTHPLVKAVAFTGSFSGGKVLFDAAVTRPDPIPVYAEMGSINPVFILPGKLKENAAGIAQSLAISNTLGVGQFCTNAGIMVMIASPESSQFISAFQQCLSGTTGGTMLTPSIYESYSGTIKKLKRKSQLDIIAEGTRQDLPHEGIPCAFSVAGQDFFQDKELSEECFGPSSIHVMAESREQLIDIATRLSGQLTASVWATAEDCKDFEQLFHVLENKAGRLLVNNVPTGVEVTHAMIHGGPFPATTDGRTTSVGTMAIYRFTRPVCYQNFPAALLPEALKDDNPLLIWRMVNGEFTKDG